MLRVENHSVVPIPDPPPLTLDKTAILEALEFLRQKVRRRRSPADDGRFALNPPLAVADVEVFEAKHNITLPADYKYFITQIGNGGGYHLFPLGEWSFDDAFHKIDEPEWRIIGDLSQPFPHTEDWKFPDSLGITEPDPAPGTPPTEIELLRNEWEEKLQETCADRRLMNGAFPICHLGCGDSQWLVVNGPQKGFVWSQYGLLTISKLRDAEGRQMTFTDWYLSRLQAARDQPVHKRPRRIRAGPQSHALLGWVYFLAACSGVFVGRFVAAAVGLRGTRASRLVSAGVATALVLLVTVFHSWHQKRRASGTTTPDEGA